VRIGIDLGGPHIEAIALDDRGRERFRRRVATPRGDYAGTIETLRALVAGAEAQVGESTVGIGIPGAVSPATGLIKNANSTWLNGQPLAEDLASALGRPVRLANDANCFALSEATDGAAAGCRTVFGVIVGTGTGGGIVVDGRVLVGGNAIAGEWGHNPMPWPGRDEWPGPPCYCGRTGCIETFLSGPGLARDCDAAAGPGLTATDVVSRAERGDRRAIDALARYEDRMARALASVINIVDPDAIVLGGGLSNLSRLYSRIPEIWGAYVFSDRVSTRLLPPTHGDSSGVRGAAWLWNDT
jgi:fructokinase